MLILDRLRAGEPLDAVVAELKLNAVHHDDGRTILNYDQIASPKRDPVARECRGLVIDRHALVPVARPFPRFFNLGECPDEESAFDWSTATTAEKVDGSLALLYHHGGEWRVNTRGSFAAGKPHPDCPHTWEGVFWLALFGVDDVRDHLDSAFTYVFELCSPWNQVVAYHPTPCLYLLAAVETATGDELADLSLDRTAEALGVRRPKRYAFRTAAEVLAFLKDAELHPTFEGFVVKDGCHRRLKVKNPGYVALHALKGNGNLLLAKNIVPLVLAGEADEVAAYFPDMAPRFREVQSVIDAAADRMLAVWDAAGDLPTQKEFALAVLGDPLAGILFTARKTGRHPLDVLKDSPDQVLKALFRTEPVPAG